MTSSASNQQKKNPFLFFRFSCLQSLLRKNHELSMLFLATVVNSVNGTLSRPNTSQSRECTQTRTVIDNHIRK